MARIEQFRRSKRQTFKSHPTSLVCHYAFFETPSGKKVLQLDTAGSPTRENPGKQSQTLQLDAGPARQLWELLGREFGFSA
jgi:hypothetical protein